MQLDNLEISICVCIGIGLFEYFAVLYSTSVNIEKENVVKLGVCGSQFDASSVIVWER